MGFESTRGDPNGLAADALDHSAKVSMSMPASSANSLGAGVSDGIVYRRGWWLPGTGRVSSFRHRARKPPLQLPDMVRFSSFENLLCQVEFFKWHPLALPS